MPKRKHVNDGGDPSSNTLFGARSNGPSLTDSLFGDESSTTNDLFASPTRFDTVVQDRIDKNTQKCWREDDKKKNVLPEETCTQAILSLRRQQADSPFINEISAMAPFPADCQEEKGDNDKMIPPDVAVQEIADIVRMNGFGVVRNVVSKSLLDKLSEKAKEIEDQVCKSLNGRNIEWKSNTETFRFMEVASRCKGRMDVRHMTNQEPFSVPAIIENESIKPIIDCLLGGSSVSDASHAPILLYAGLIFSFPGSDDQPWHQDGMPLFAELSPSEAMLPPYAINVFLPLTDTDASLEAGPTEFIPASHVMEEELVLQKVDGCTKNTNNDGKTIVKKGVSCKEQDDDEDVGIVCPILKQGDALLYDYRVCHRGTTNLTSQTRRILYLMYARPWFKEHLNFGSENLFGKEKG